MVASDRVFRVLDNDDYIKTQGDFAPARLKGKVEFDKQKVERVQGGGQLALTCPKFVGFEDGNGSFLVVVGERYG